MVDIYDNDTPENELNIKPIKRNRADVERAVAVAIESFSKDNKDISKITASGYGALAEQILAMAFENGVKVREDKDLAQMLAAVEVDSEIPSEALIAVAEILSYVYKLNGTYKKPLSEDLNNE
jgi:flagellar biosynthesis protein|tara:strand:- start:31 stop:399 length:369 start_codon:yes stop_codon:yes gene_type:complete